MAEFLVLAAIVKVVVDRVKARFSIDGDIITAAAAAVGVGLAFLLQVDVATDLIGSELSNGLGTVVTGIGIGLGAGFLNDALAAVRGGFEG
jgi:hypothetical protein